MQPVFIAKKGKTTQQYDADMRRIPVTLLTTPPVYLVDVKTPDKDGYSALKLTLGTSKHRDKPTLGVLKKAGITAIPEIVSEIRCAPSSDDRVVCELIDGKKILRSGDTQLPIGSALTASAMFKVGDTVDVTGVSKGKGFQGVVKRHRFRGGPKTHGQSDRWRSPGSVGSGTTPGRINKGKRMAGRMGGEKVTIQGLTIINISEDALTVKGLIPGRVGTPIVVRLASPTTSSHSV